MSQKSEIVIVISIILFFVAPFVVMKVQSLHEVKVYNNIPKDALTGISIVTTGIETAEGTKFIDALREKGAEFGKPSAYTWKIDEKVERWGDVGGIRNYLTVYDSSSNIVAAFRTTETDQCRPNLQETIQFIKRNSKQ